MTTDDGQHFICEEEGCEAKIKNHSWGKIKAAGWFFLKDGQSWCPEHIPPWVGKWRKSKL